MFFFLNRSFFISIPHPRRFKVTKNFRERSEPYNLQRLCEATNVKDFRFNVNNGSSKTSCLTGVSRTFYKNKPYFTLTVSKFLGATVSTLNPLCMELAKSRHLEFSP